MGRVLVTHPLPEGATDLLAAAGHELVEPDGRSLVEWAPEVDGILCLLTDPIDAAVLRSGAAGRLRVVSLAAVGHDNVDLAAAAALGITVCNTPGVLDESTADLAFLLVLAANRLASDAERDLRSGKWEGWGIMDHLGQDVWGTTLGLVGYGRIGRAVARRAAGFGMEVLHHTRTDTGLPGYLPTLHELLARSDTVSLHVPLTPETHHLIGEAELALMKPTAVLVNTARGAVVDEGALARALERGELHAAGLDVYSREPDVDPAILSAP
ncbi:MAG TPA: D-glycerate dehydrogenase, partial [Acidimicrobiales bacterium]|nr:D-glycerate dehydrogenase [Acidimicrobiales bacterium]